MSHTIKRVKIHNSFHDTTAIVALHGDYHGEFIKADAYRRARKKLCPNHGCDVHCDCHIHDAVWNGVYAYEQLYMIAAVAQTMVRK